MIAAPFAKQLNGRYERLKAELAKAHEQQPLPIGTIDRLVGDISEVEREIEAVGQRIEAGKAGVSTEGCFEASPTATPTSGPRAVGFTVRVPFVTRNRITPFGPRGPEATAK